jgi:CheY-like chemotaxis protein
MMALTRPIHILMVEDNPGDVRLAQEALRQAKVANSMDVVSDGVRAVEYLCGKGDFEESPTPDLVLLDLNLPRMSGVEVLRKIKSCEVHSRIPVVVLTSSKAEEDVLRSYELHANCYVTKPVDFKQFVEVVKSISHFWFAVVELPTAVKR